MKSISKYTTSKIGIGT